MITRISRVYAPVTTTVVQVTEVGPGQLLATAVLGSPEGRVPAIVSFVARDGSWYRHGLGLPDDPHDRRVLSRLPLTAFTR
ncbi:hypothetical protein ACW9HJ_13775 [Nocardia gipuzkoensis]